MLPFSTGASPLPFLAAAGTLLLLGVPKISLYYKIDTLRHYGEPVYDRSALKVMAYNVRMFYGDDGRSTVDSLAAFVNRYDPDILCDAPL